MDVIELGLLWSTVTSADCSGLLIQRSRVRDVLTAGRNLSNHKEGYFAHVQLFAGPGSAISRAPDS